MTELLENSDNTNVDTGVSKSPANEATISLAAVQALADALQKIEAYTPTVWVDNESPDIDAAHLNKAEQAIMRVTTAMNSAVDVIKDLQSQVNTTNNNLGNGVFKALTFSDFSASDDIKTVCQKMFSTLPASNACYRIRMEPTPNGTTADAYVYCASSKYGFVHIRNHSGIDYYGRVQNGTWSWDSYALKSDLIQDGIYDVTTDSNGSISINSIISGMTIDRFVGAYFYSEAVDANVLTRIHLYKKYVFAIAINPDGNAKYANKTMKMHIWYRKS